MRGHLVFKLHKRTQLQFIQYFAILELENFDYVSVLYNCSFFDVSGLIQIVEMTIKGLIWVLAYFHFSSETLLRTNIKKSSIFNCFSNVTEKMQHKDLGPIFLISQNCLKKN